MLHPRRWDMRRSLLPVVCASVVLFAHAQEPLSLFWCGALQPTSANERVRAAQPGDTLQLLYCAAPCPNGPLTTPALVSDTITDNVLSFLLDDLQPGTHYTYRFAVNGVVDTTANSLGRFSTPFSAAFMPLVPHASMGRRGVLSQTSTPRVSMRPASRS